MISLRNALSFAEKEIGLDKLSEFERKLYYAALDCADDLGNFSSEIIRSSKWCKNIPHATYHRALTSLLKNNTFLKVVGSERNRYCLPPG